MILKGKSRRTTSYFLPMLFLGTLLILLGLSGVYAASLAACEHAHRLEIMSLRIQHMRLQGVSTAILGLVVSVWAFDRRTTYRRLSAGQRDEPDAMGMRLRNLALGGFLVILMAAVFLPLRESVPDWMRYVRRRAGIRKVREIRLILARHGIPAESVGLDGKGGRLIAVYLEGPGTQSVAALSGLPINHLSLRQTRVTDLTPLKECPLSGLVLRGTRLDDISFLAETSIRALDLRETGILDLHPLAQMPNLKWVKLSRDQITANLEVLNKLNVTVQIVDGGPAWDTTGAGWQREFGDGN